MSARDDVVDGRLDDRVGRARALRISTAPGSDTSATIPECPGSDRVLELVGQLAAVVQLTRLADGRAGAPSDGGAPEDGRREDDAEHGATDEAPLETATSCCGPSPSGRRACRPPRA